MKLMLPIDGSKDALAAVRRALALVDGGLRASFVLVNVQAPPSLYEMLVADDAAEIEAASAGAAEHLLGAAEALLVARAQPFETAVAHGDPRIELLALAEGLEVDLIVIGARGQETDGDDAIGPVAEAVLRDARVPVLLVREAIEPTPTI